MRYIEDDSRVRKLIRIYESYFTPLKGRAQREGPDYLFHAFKAVLDHERLPIWRMDEKLMPASNGGSFLLIDGRYLVGLVIEEALDEEYIIRRLDQIQDIGNRDYTNDLIILNFGGEIPEWYPFEPEEEDYYDDYEEEDCYDDDEFDFDDDDDDDNETYE